MFLSFVKLVFVCLFVMVGLSQLIYILFFWFKFLFYKEEKATQNGFEQGVSVLIACKNEEKNLDSHLPNWLNQSHENFEVVVINDSSVDDSIDVLNAFKTNERLQVVNLMQEHIKTTGKKFALSLGIKRAKNEILLLTDADCIPKSNGWITAMQQAYNAPNTEIVLGYGTYEKRPTLVNYCIQFDTLFIALNYFSMALSGNTYMGVGRNLSYKKELFVKNKGFSSKKQQIDKFGDDDLFVQQNATKTNVAIAIGEDSHTVSLPKTTFGTWFEQKSRHTSSSKFYTWHSLFWINISFWSWVLLPVLGLIGVFIIKNWVLKLTLLAVLGAISTLRWVSIGAAALKLKENRLLFYIPILDILYPFFQIFWTLKGYIFKVRHWR